MGTSVINIVEPPKGSAFEQQLCQFRLPFNYVLSSILTWDGMHCTDTLFPSST